MKAQAFIWVNCLKRLQNINPADIFVHITPGRSQFRDWLSSEKVKIVEVGRFDSRNAHCNKIQQLASFCQTTYDQIVFMDCDTAWVGKESLPRGQPVSARIVDYANPPAPVLLKIFVSAGFGSPDWWPVVFPQVPDRELTDVNNCNGGLYIFAGDFVADLEPSWRRWALWCLDNSHLFESWSLHADQVSFALAMRELNAKVCHLPLAWNYPTHIVPVAKLPDISPQIIHYHREMTDHLTLKTIGIPRVDNAINKLNGSIGNFIGENPLAADLRFNVDPIGSRGSVNRVDIDRDNLGATRHLAVTNSTELDAKETAAVKPRGTGAIGSST